jgi:hypothetical protein
VQSKAFHAASISLTVLVILRAVSGPNSSDVPEFPAALSSCEQHTHERFFFFPPVPLLLHFIGIISRRTGVQPLKGIGPCDYEIQKRFAGIGTASR